MEALDLTHLFSHALGAEPERLHFAAHSHHFWPDATRAAQERAWLDAAERADEKWDHIFGDVYPKAQAHVARTLGVLDPTQVAFSANTHDLIVRLFSATAAWEANRPLKVLSVDAEFHSFTRQMRRLVEAGRAEWTTIPAEPFETLPERFEAAARGTGGDAGWDVVFTSHVFYSSGWAFDEAFGILAGLPDETLCVVDGYHGYFALPTNIGRYAHRIYYTSGGYKYAMAGEGACFLVAPHERELRPGYTGWFAGFSSLGDAQSDQVGYDAGAARLLGATFEPTPLYRFNAVCDALEGAGLGIDALHGHALALQEQFLGAVAEGRTGSVIMEDLLPSRESMRPERRGHFLTFRRDDAGEFQARMQKERIVTDCRGDRLRFGFGAYQTKDDVERLVERLGKLG